MGCKASTQTNISFFIFSLQSELQLLQSIIPEKYQRSVYDNIVQPGLESVVNEGEVSHHDSLLYIVNYNYYKV